MPPPDPRAARASVGEIEGLRDGLWVRGVARVLLAGAGGVGVAAEVLAGEGARLTVLDGCDPVQLAEALASDLASTVLVVSAPPGADTGALEIVWAEVAAAQAAEGLEPAGHTVLVAPPGSPLVARAGGAPVVPGPAHVARQTVTSHAPQTVRRDSQVCDVGAWAALTPYALVPAGLAGADVGALLRDALASSGADGSPPAGAAGAGEPGGGPAAPSGAREAGGGPAAPRAAGGPAAPSGAGAAPGAAEIADRLRGATGHIALTGPLAESLAQLLAVLEHHQPLIVEEPGSPGWDNAVLTVGGPKADVPAEGPVASELLRWQHVVTGLLDRPGRSVVGLTRAEAGGDTASAAAGIAAVLGEVELRASWPASSRSAPSPPLTPPPLTTPPLTSPRLTSPTASPPALMPPPACSPPVVSLTGALAGLVDGATSLAVHAHLDRHDDASAALLRAELSTRTGLVTAFGWGGRALPGAPAVLQITGAGPDGPAAAHQRAVADAEAATMAGRGVRVLSLHLTDRLIGLVELVRAVQELPDLQ